MTYVERKARKVLADYAGGDRYEGSLLEQDLEALIRQVIEDCAREAEDKCTGKATFGEQCTACRACAARIRALASKSTST